jgi:hypothetical protein
MKKLFISLLSIVLLGGVSFAIYENGTLLSPEFKTMNLQAAMNGATVDLSWNTFQLPAGHIFGWWKVLRSSTSENPIYVDGNNENVIFQSSDITLTKFKHMSPSIGNNWYRVCAITQANDGYHTICSSEVKNIGIVSHNWTLLLIGSQWFYPPETRPMNFQAVLENGVVSLSWKPFEVPAEQTFISWELLRSNAVSPVYVDGNKDNIVVKSNDITITKFKDTAPRIWNNRYKVCMITRAIAWYHKYCSNDIRNVIIPWSADNINKPKDQRMVEFKPMNFQANLENNIVYMSWNPFELPSGQTFAYRKIMRSQGTESPVYINGKGDYLTHSSDINLTSFKELKPKNWTNWYRICAITKWPNGYRSYCSLEVKKITITSSPTNKPEVKTPDTTNQVLTEEQKATLDLMAAEFLKNLEIKYADNYLKKKMVLGNVITQLRKLANKQPRMKAMILYLVNKLGWESDDSLDQLRNILRVN